METLTKTFSSKLDDHISKIPHADYVTKIQELADHCDVTVHIVYNWRAGRTYIRKPYREAIEQFFNEQIF